MNFKKFLSLLLIFCLVFSFTACGGRDVDNDDDDDSSYSSRDDDDDDDKDNKGKDSKDKDKDDDKDTDSKDDDEDKDSDSEEDDKKTGSKNDIFANYPEVDLPKGYPKDEYPLYKDGRVWMGLKEEKNGYNVFSVAVVYAEEFDAIVDYYEDLLVDAKDYDDIKSDYANIYTGELAGYKFEITIIPTQNEGDLAQSTIILTEIPSSSSVLKSLDNGEYPDNYPKSDFPIIDGGVIYDASESENSGLVSYDLTIYTDKDIKEVVKFYDDNLKNVQDKSKSSSTDDFNISGSSNGYYFYIYGYKDTRDNVEVVRYTMTLDPIDE